MRAIQESSGGRLTLISEDDDDTIEIQLLCELADVIEYGGTISTKCEKTDTGGGVIFEKPQQLVKIYPKRQPKRKK